MRAVAPEKHPPTPEEVGMAKVTSDPFYREYHPNVDVQTKGSGQGMDGSGFDNTISDLEAPSASGRASARGMARVMAMLAGGGELDGVRVLSEAGRDEAIANLEAHLSATQFRDVLGMGRPQFYAMTKVEQMRLKKDCGLF